MTASVMQGWAHSGISSRDWPATRPKVRERMVRRNFIFGGCLWVVV